jgi:hypothetical protein
MARYFATVLLLVVGVGCASSPPEQPIDIHDESVPVEARVIVADAQDSVAVAEARRDEARRAVERTLEWKKDLLARDWPSGAGGLTDSLRKMASARVELARLSLERANRKVELARAKYHLVGAKTAVRHDLGVYELEPYRKQVRQRESALEKVDGRVASQRRETSRLTDEWWATYREHVQQGGESRALYASGLDEIPGRELRSTESSDDEGDGEQQAAADSSGESSESIEEMVDEKKSDQKSDQED